MKINTLNQCTIGFIDDDIVEAMKDIEGYIDITPSDFKEIYQIASRHALERLKNAIKAEQVMTTPVITVYEEDSLHEAAILMAEHSISGLPVINDQQLVSGVISEKDFLKKLAEENERKSDSFMSLIAQCLEIRGCLAADLKNLRVRDIMSSPPVMVLKSKSIMEIAALFESSRINRVPVIDENSNLVGIIARSDIVQALC